MMNRLFCILLVLTGCVSLVHASDLRLSKKVEVVKVENGVATLGVDVVWTNSWRDEYNNDAIWLFFKYRTIRTDWEHLNLSEKMTVGKGYTAYPGKTANEITGCFIYRDTVGFGNAVVRLEVDWHYPSWLTQDMFTSGEVMLLAQGVEMVLVPFGNYTLGDGMSLGSFSVPGSTNPITVSSEASFPVSMLNDISASGERVLNADYPKGYNGFYCMKYELSQSQYVCFVNCLSRTEQLKLMGNRIQGIAKGSFLFGGGGTASFRNTIIVREQMTETRAMVLASENETVAATCPIACNYLSPLDILGYASWSGLRPMSELEYEKICRRSAPLLPVPGCYAWGDDTYQPISGLTEAGTDKERPQSGNVNGGSNGANIVGGPVRCGAFSNIGRDKESSGSSFSGVMELSGNVRELVVNVDAIHFKGLLHGNGTFDPEYWTGVTDVNVFGTRGGGFNSPASRLRVSDRSEIKGIFTTLDQRLPDVGFRCVRMFDASTIKVDPGTIKGDGIQKYCTGKPFRIAGDKNASIPGLGGVEIHYQWYMDGGEITGAQGHSLEFPAGLNNAPVYADKTYRFTRKANSVLGMAETQPVEVIVYGIMALDVAPASGTVTSSDATEFKAGVQHAGEVSWWVSGDSPRLLAGPSPVSRGDEVSYTPSYFDFNYKTGTYPIICKASTPTGCIDSMIISLKISVDILPGKLSAPDRICMGEQLNITATSAVLPGMPAGVKPVYRWYRNGIVLPGESGENLTVSSGLKGGLDYIFFRRSAVDDGSYKDSDTVKVHIERCLPLKPDGKPYATVMVDTNEWLAENLLDTEKCGRSWDNSVYGRLYDWEAAACSCPPGWRLPDNQDWLAWERKYGLPDLGRMMKSVTDDWMLGGKGSNETGFTGLPGGYMRTAAGVVNDQGIKGYWWSSTREGTNPSYFELSNQSSDLTVKTLTRTNGLSVRCVRNE